MFYLLDLNYTLVANSQALRCKGSEYRYSNEQYRRWLIDLLKATKPAGIILLTIRPSGTLKSLFVARRRTFGPMPILNCGGRAS